jgi:hypothetical protein
MIFSKRRPKRRTLSESFKGSSAAEEIKKDLILFWNKTESRAARSAAPAEGERSFFLDLIKWVRFIFFPVFYKGQRKREGFLRFAHKSSRSYNRFAGTWKKEKKPFLLPDIYSRIQSTWKGKQLFFL